MVFKPGYSRRHAIAHPSHVCLPLEYHVTANFGYLIQVDAASIAIWNRNKVVVALMILIGVINIGCGFQGKPLPLIPPAEDLKYYGIPHNRGMVNRYRDGE